MGVCYVMIKEFKVNLYRLLRSRSFLVICIILLISSIFCAVEIMFCVDDPLGVIDGFYSGLEEGAAEVAAMTEEGAVDATETDEVLIDDELNNDELNNDELNNDELSDNGSIDVEVNDTETNPDEIFSMLFSQSYESLKNSNTYDGVLRMTLPSGTLYFLYALLVALFIGSEFKSRFHVNRYSLNSNPMFIVCGEVLTLFFVVIALEVFCYAVSLGFTRLFCSSFYTGDLGVMLKHFALTTLISFVFVSLAFMIAYIRKGIALAITFSALFSSGIFDVIFMIFSIWFHPFRYFAITTSQADFLYSSDYSTVSLITFICVLVMYIVVFLGTTLLVAAKRDPY